MTRPVDVLQSLMERRKALYAKLLGENTMNDEKTSQIPGGQSGRPVQPEGEPGGCASPALKAIPPLPKDADEFTRLAMTRVLCHAMQAFQSHPIRSQEKKGCKAEVIIKLFGGSAYTMLVTEAERQPDGDWLLFGYATLGYGWEWGYASLREISSDRFPPFGLPVEIDLYVPDGATVADMAD